MLSYSLRSHDAGAVLWWWVGVDGRLGQPEKFLFSLVLRDFGCCCLVAFLGVSFFHGGE